MYDPSWRDFETIACACCIILSILCLVLISVTVSRECNEIFLSGDDCGVGYGWSGLAGGFIVIGAISAWEIYRLVGGRQSEESVRR